MDDLKLVVFDMDGTLIDSQEIIVNAMNLAFAVTGHPPPQKSDVLSIVGLSLDRVMTVLLPDLNAEQNAIVVAAYRQAFLDLRAKMGGKDNTRLYPGAITALEHLHGIDSVLLGVATGKAMRGLDYVYNAHNIGKYFVTSQTADGHPSKPHPEMLFSALRETGVAANRAVMVGDTEFDMEMGRAAGFSTIGVSWGYHPVSRIKAAGADIIIDSYGDLDDALNEIWAAAS